MSAPSVPSAIGYPAEIARWSDRAGDDPESALRKAKRWLSQAANDTEARVLARHVAALASLERGLVADGRRHARLGVLLACRLGMRDMEVRLRLTLAYAELQRGSGRACHQQLRALRSRAGEHEQAKVSCVRGMLLHHRDRHGDAVAELTTAAGELERRGERRWAADALFARALAFVSSGRLDDADTDLVRAGRMFGDEGLQQRAALCLHNRGNLALRAGALSQALRFFADAVASGLDDEARPDARAERATALAAAGIHHEVRTELERAVTQLAALGLTAPLGEVHQALAECDLREGAPGRALESAHEARRVFRAQGRPGRAALADVTRRLAAVESGHRSRYAFATARRAAARCRGHGWAEAAAQLQLACGRAARENGMPATARSMFAAASTYARDDTLPASQQALGRLAAALLANCTGDRRGVFEACDAGLRLVDEHASAQRAAGLGAPGFGLAGQLTEAALDAAVRTGDPDVALLWSERCRSGALHQHDSATWDPELRKALDELRRAVAGSRAYDVRLRSTYAGVAELEDRVRDTALLVACPGPPVEPDTGVDGMSRTLQDEVLVSFFTVGAMVHSVSVVDGEALLMRHGREADLGAEVDRLRHCLQRQATATDTRIARAFASGARQAADTLERTLLAPVRSQLIQRGRMVVVPTGRLYMLPWAALPLCRGTAVTVVPSFRCWLQARGNARRGAPGNRHVWVAGPGLDHADSEVAELHATAGGKLLTGTAATTTEVLREMDGAATVHIAAHGWFRADRPLLSCLDLADGPVYGYDLGRLWRGPTTVVLSACEVGRSAVGHGEELRGLAAAFLCRGTATVIAGVVTVPDERTAKVMLDVHAGLRRGIPPAEALARAQSRHGESGFVCLGYGGT